MNGLSNQLHEDARRRFEDLGRSLLGRVRTFRQPSKEKPSRFSPDSFTEVTLTGREILGDLHVFWTDHDGRRIGIAVAEAGGARTGLIGPDYKELEALAVAMSQVQPFRSTASVEFLLTEIFEWTKKRHRRQSSEACVDFVLRALEGKATKHRMLFPVSDLHVQSALTLGSVTLSTFPESIFEQLESTQIDAASAEARTELSRSWRKDFQGSAVAETSVFGEPIRAREIGSERVGLAVGVLRFFAPGHLNSGVTSRVARWGRAPQRSESVFFVGASGQFLSMSSSIVDRSGTMVVDDELRAVLLEAGLSEVRDILARDAHTDLEQALLTGMINFGRAALTSDNRERIVWYCAGLESLLLKNTSEPIAHNLSERLAMYSYSTVDERTAAVNDVRKAYALRSRFVHHGVEIEEGEIVTRFARHGLALFSRVARNVARFSSRDELLAHIDRMKLSGGLR